MRVIAFHALQLVTAAEHPVEFVDEESDGFVAFIGFDHGIHVRALDDNVALRFEARADGCGGITLQLDAEPQDAFLVAKQSLGFFADERFERRSQLEMNARHDDFAMVLAVHVSAYGLG